MKLLKTVNNKTYQTVFAFLMTDIRIKVSLGAQLSTSGYKMPTLMVGTEVSSGAL